MTRKPAAGLPVPEQLGVAQAEERSAQDADHRGPVVGVGERAQQVGQPGDGRRLREGRPAAHLDGQSQGLERPRVDRQGLPGPGQDQEIAGRAPARVHLRPDESRDHRGVERGHRVAARDGLGNLEGAHAERGAVLVAGGLEAGEARLMRRGLGREQRAEGAVRPSRTGRARSGSTR